jgi:hypothetical protein
VARQRVVIEGDEEVRRQLEALVAGVENLNVTAGTEAARIVAERAYERAPHQSGALRDDIRTFAQKRNAGFRVGRARIPYAGPVVGGHGSAATPRAQGGWIRPNPFPFDALDARYSAVIETYERFIQKLVDGEPVRNPQKYRNHDTGDSGQ